MKVAPTLCAVASLAACVTSEPDVSTDPGFVARNAQSVTAQGEVFADVCLLLMKTTNMDKARLTLADRGFVPYRHEGQSLMFSNVEAWGSSQSPFQVLLADRTTFAVDSDVTRLCAVVNATGDTLTDADKSAQASLLQSELETQADAYARANDEPVSAGRGSSDNIGQFWRKYSGSVYVGTSPNQVVFGTTQSLLGLVARR